MTQFSDFRNEQRRCLKGRGMVATITVALCAIAVLAGSLAAQENSNSRANLPLIAAGGNQAPVANGETYDTAEDKPLFVTAGRGVLANDTDPDQNPLQAALASDVSHGILRLNRNGSFQYTPDPNFYGQDSFTYFARDGRAASGLATVKLQVSARNDSPRIVTGDVTFAKLIIGEGVGGTHAVVAADLDGDGDIDAAATDYWNGLVPWFENDGKGNFVERALDADLEGAYPLSLGDLDSDGDPDVLAAGYLADTFVWYRNDGEGTLVRQNIDTTADGAHSIIPVDMDFDGDIDLVTSSQDANTIAWYENDGSQRFTEHVVDDAALKAKRAEGVDIDGDGDMDIVTASFDSFEIAWHENDGTMRFSKRSIDITASGAYYVSPADADNDGDVDVFSASQWANRIAWHENDGTGGFANYVIDSNAVGARTVIATDLDQDGYVDALAASVEDDTVAWYRNDGSGNFTKRVIDQAADGAYGVFAVDMDQDGDTDLLSASRDSYEIALYTQTQVQEAMVGKGGKLVIDSSVLRVVDVDDDPATSRYTITSTPQFGQLQVSGNPLSSGGTFTQADVDNGRVVYVHNGIVGLPDEFSFTVADGGEDGSQPKEGSFSISITSTQ